MSLSIIRKALEQRLAALAPAIATAYENAPFVPAVGTPYQRVSMLPATPDNSTQGATLYLEIGIFQVTLMWPMGVGPSVMEDRAQLLRAHFKRGTSMVESGITVIVTKTPSVAPAFVDGDRFTVPVSIAFQAQVAT